MMEDKILGQAGLYTMWTMFFISNLAVLSEDDTRDVSRDFNIIANGLSVLYVSASGLNMIYGNGLPSTMMLTIGPIHQYLFWMLFVYYGGSDVLGSHPIGVYNWFTLFIVGMFTLDMVVKTWFITIDNGKMYRDYVSKTIESRTFKEPHIEVISVTNSERSSTKGSASDSDSVCEEVPVNIESTVNNEEVQNVVAKFTFKDNNIDVFKTMLNDPENGLNLTKACEGYIDINLLVDEDNPNVLILVQKWKTKQNHLDYLKKRTEMGMFDKLKEMLEIEPEIRYVKHV